MAKDRIERDELASKLIETASSADDPLRAMTELLTDFVMEAEVTAKVGAEVHERSAERTTHRNGHRERRWDTRGWERSSCRCRSCGKAATFPASSSIANAASRH
jgi:hypothetical protein